MWRAQYPSMESLVEALRARVNNELGLDPVPPLKVPKGRGSDIAAKIQTAIEENTAGLPEDERDKLVGEPGSRAPPLRPLSLGARRRLGPRPQGPGAAPRALDR